MPELSRWLLSLLLLCSLPLAAADHAVVLIYHHVSDDTPPSTSVSPAQFQAHLDYLSQHDYRVLPLSDLLESLLQGEAVPDKSVAITFDDAYRSVYTEAAPRLQRLGWPFTVFLADQPLDQGLAQFMSWEELRLLLGRGAEVGAHSSTHAHLARRLAGESEADWEVRVAHEIDHNLKRIRQELGVEARSFAYPYGEYNPALKRLLAQRGLYGIAQQSGALGAHTDPQQVPRFPMATGFADLQRFRTAVDSRPLPVAKETWQGPAEAPQRLLLELRPGDYRSVAIGCYAASGEPLDLQRPQSEQLLIALPATRPGRNKINCTAPSRQQGGVFYWHSVLWLGD